MGYLTYNEYTSFGGKCTEDVFSQVEPVAEVYIDNYTMGRLKVYKDIPTSVKVCLTSYVNVLSEGAIAPSSLTSYSNGVESFSFKTDVQRARESKLYSIAVGLLPVELISAFVGDFIERDVQGNGYCIQ